jgi:hypothetical protein
LLLHHTAAHQQTLSKLHTNCLIVFRLNCSVVKMFRLFVPPSHLVDRMRTIFVRLMRSAHDPLHQTDMKRKHIVKAREILLRIEVGWIGDDPLSVFGGNDIPNLIGIA